MRLLQNWERTLQRVRQQQHNNLHTLASENRQQNSIFSTLLLWQMSISDEK